MKISFIRTLLVASLVATAGIAQSGETDATGSIVAFQKTTRCSECNIPTGTAVFSEFWIVRINSWPKDTVKKYKYVLTDYQIFRRGITDEELNSSSLKFSFDQERTNAECVGIVVDNRNNSRSVIQNDFVKTENGLKVKIPEIRKLPCFVVSKVPEVISK